jgi:rhodanese-related sulfurtransferase
MKKLFQITFLLLIVSVSAPVTAQTKHIMVQPDKAEKVIKKKNLQILAVRTPEEVQGGHLSNAINLDFKAPDFESKISSLPREKPYFVYCRSGVRSGKAAELMKKMGFRKVYELKGGITAYKGILAHGSPKE